MIPNRNTHCEDFYHFVVGWYLNEADIPRAKGFVDGVLKRVGV